MSNTSCYIFFRYMCNICAFIMINIVVSCIQDLLKSFLKVLTNRSILFYDRPIISYDHKFSEVIFIINIWTLILFNFISLSQKRSVQIIHKVDIVKGFICCFKTYVTDKQTEKSTQKQFNIFVSLFIFLYLLSVTGDQIT